MGFAIIDTPEHFIAWFGVVSTVAMGLVGLYKTIRATWRQERLEDARLEDQLRRHDYGQNCIPPPDDLVSGDSGSGIKSGPPLPRKAPGDESR